MQTELWHSLPLSSLQTQNLSGSSCGEEANSFLAALHLEAIAHQLLMILGLHAVFNKHDLGVHGINYQADEANPRAVC